MTKEENIKLQKKIVLDVLEHFGEAFVPDDYIEEYLIGSFIVPIIKLNIEDLGYDKFVVDKDLKRTKKERLTQNFERWQKRKLQLKELTRDVFRVYQELGRKIYDRITKGRVQKIFRLRIYQNKYILNNGKQYTNRYGTEIKINMRDYAERIRTGNIYERRTICELLIGTLYHEITHLLQVYEINSGVQSAKILNEAKEYMAVSSRKFYRLNYHDFEIEKEASYTAQNIFQKITQGTRFEKQSSKFIEYCQESRQYHTIELKETRSKNDRARIDLLNEICDKKMKLRPWLRKDYTILQIEYGRFGRRKSLLEILKQRDVDFKKLKQTKSEESGKLLEASRKMYHQILLYALKIASKNEIREMIRVKGKDFARKLFRDIRGYIKSEEIEQLQQTALVEENRVKINHYTDYTAIQDKRETKEIKIRWERLQEEKDRRIREISSRIEKRYEQNREKIAQLERMGKL